jgi:GT2 family glycosyltransferase
MAGRGKARRMIISAQKPRNTPSQQAEQRMSSLIPSSDNEALAILQATISPVSFWPPDYATADSAWLEHAPFAFWLIEALRPRSLVELGTHSGLSYFAFCQAVQRLQLETCCYAVDTWKGDEHAGFYGEEIFSEVHKRNDQRYSAFSTLIRSTFDQASLHFRKNSIDLLHIDGRHFYKDVKHDFDNWRTKLSNRAIVIFHDTNVRERDFGVSALWKELSRHRPHFEFFHGHGLGILGIGNDLPDRILALFATRVNAEASTYIRRAYSRLGSAVTLQVRTEQIQLAAESQVVGFNRALAERDAKIIALDQGLVDRQHEVDALKAAIAEQDARILALDQVLAGRIYEVDALKATIGEQEGRIAALGQVLAERSQEIDALKTTIGEQEGRIVALGQALAERDYEVDALKATIGERNAKMVALGQVLANRQHEVDTLKAAVGEQDAKMVALGQVLANRQHEVDTLKAAVGEQDAKIVALDQVLADRQHEVDTLKATIAARDQALMDRSLKAAALTTAIADRESQIVVLQSMVRALRLSTSWRITAPLRVAKKSQIAFLELMIRALRFSTSWRINPLSEAKRLLRGPQRAKRTIGRDRDQINRRELEVIRDSKMFDEEWYKSKYPDVSKAGINPIEHYLLWGAAQGRDPCQHFSTSFYLKNNPDVVKSALNPLFHYIEYGRIEGRQAQGNEGHQAQGNDYQTWVERFDSLSDAERATIKSEINRFSKRPLISVLMPVYNTNRKWLIKAIESVRTQLYPNWELCISDDASTSPHVKAILDSYARTDQRIRVIYRDTNGHISLNSNSALALATGEFIALLDHDDELPSHALFWVAREILRYRDVDMVYSDEDKIDDKGRRHDAYFKPDWNPALILSQNFFNHLGIYRRSLVEQVGGFRVGFEGSQDHDLVLRCADASAPERIRHIPRVLYHWRSVKGSTASAAAIEAKPYATHATVRAIKEHCAKHNIAANVRRAITQFYQVDYQVSARLPKVSIIIPTTGDLKLFRPCIESLFARTSYPNLEILIAISKSHRTFEERGDYLDKLRTDSRVRVLIHEIEPYSYAKVNNWAAQHAAGSVICFLNDDVEVITPDWLEKLVMRLELEGVGAVGPMLYYPDDTIQHAGVILGLGGVAGHAFNHLKRGSAGYFGRAALEQDLSCITAACMAMRRALFEELNGFNEELAIAFNDVDLCIRIRRAGWRIIWTPQVEMYHHESATLGRHNSPERQATFEREVAWMRKRWGEVLDRDPFYNPNLSLNVNFTLAFPPRQERIPVTE